MNIAKGSFRFTALMYLKASLEHIDAMPRDSFDKIEGALTNQINDRALFINGIDVSGRYEGCSEFKT